MSKYYEKVCRLADYIVKTSDPKMKWMWGEALLGYALDELDKFNNTNNYTKFLTDYCDYWSAVNPAVDQSDTLAPGLITYAMYKRTNNENYKKLTDKVLDYIQNEPRLIGDCLNHLGNSIKSKLYPKSVWVDSVMMFSVFMSLYGKENNMPICYKIQMDYGIMHIGLKRKLHTQVKEFTGEEEMVGL